MKTCVDTTSAEFQNLKERSGLSDFMSEILVAHYQEEHQGEFPPLDELPGADSTNYVVNLLKLDSFSATSIKHLLKATGQESIEYAIQYLNNKICQDLTIDYSVIGDCVKITYNKRPSKFETKFTEPNDVSFINSTTYISQSLDRLQKLFGIDVIQTTTSELTKMGITEAIPDTLNASAFVFRGKVYINTDNADIDAETHELLHILLGGLRFTQPEKYFSIIQFAQQFKNYEKLSQQFKNRTQEDLNEEIFVTEYARYLKGLDSEFSNLDKGILELLNYETSRVLDSILDGDNSVKLIPENERYLKTLRELGAIVNSQTMTEQPNDFLDYASIHRMVANEKLSLMENGDLTQECI